VWIERLEIEGFRSLAGTYEFSKGLTVVVGDNESGKSSLHDALVRTLFGYSKTERRRSKGSSPLERRAPWDGSPYRLVGFVRKDDRQFRIEWDFAAHRVRLLDELGHDISGSVLAKGDEVEIGDYLLGIDLEDFRQVCCIDQEGLLAVRHSPSLGVALQEAVANIAGETPVEDALATLNDFLRTVVGARVDNLNPSPKGRLADLGRQRAELKSQLEAAEKARDELVAISRDLAKAREEHDALLVEHEGMKQRQLLVELRRLEEQLVEARRLDTAARDRPEAGHNLADDVVDAVKAARDSLSGLNDQVDRVEAEAEAVAETVSRLEREQRELIATVDGLSPYAEIDVSARDQVHTASVQLASLESPETPAPTDVPIRDPMLARYRAECESLRALAEERAQWTARRVLWVVLVVLTVGIAWSIRWLVRRLRGARPGSLDERLASYEGASLDELDARAAEEDRQIAVAEGIVAALAESKAAAETQRRALIAQIDAALDAVKAPPAPLDERVRAYLVAVERHNARTENEATLGRIQQELSRARRPQDDLDRLRREMSRAQQRLRDAYQTLGIDSDDLASAEREFDAALRLAEGETQREHDAEAAATALRSILSGDSMETLSARVAQAERLVNAHREIHGDLVGEPVADAKERSDDLDAPVRAQVQRVTELETRATQLEDEAGDPATLKEKLARIESQIDRLNEAKNAVAIARHVLSEAADELRREFAPHLNAALKRNLSRITGARYAEAMVDAELMVQVVVPETGKLQPADELSRATKDQLFLVQRLEIARLLAPTKGKAPLLLDDPFAHYDQERVRHGLEVVAEAAEERQIIVFSEDPELADIARERRAARVMSLSSRGRWQRRPQVDFERMSKTVSRYARPNGRGTATPRRPHAAPATADGRRTFFSRESSTARS
jgi:DNA repair protein SbcC/Rad50